MEINEDSIIKTTLSIQQDGNEYTVGYPYLGEYIRVPYEAVQIINEFDGTNSLLQISEKLSDVLTLTDILEFTNDLLKINFIDEINTIELKDSRKKNKKINSKFVKTVSNIFFSKTTLLGYVLLFFFLLFFYMYHPNLFPNYKDAFFSRYNGINLLLMFLSTCILTLFHEIGHYLAAVKNNVDVKFNLSTRLFFLVVEANMTNIWSISRKKRYLPLLGGICFDIVNLSILTILKLITTESFHAVIDVLIFILFIQFISHLFIFFRTDLYFVLVNYFNFPNLHESSILSMNKVIKKQEKIGNLSLSIKLYLLLILLSIPFFFLLLLFYYIPLITMLFKMILSTFQNYSLNSFIFWDNIIVVFIIILNIGLYLFAAKKKYSEKLT